MNSRRSHLAAITAVALLCWVGGCSRHPANQARPGDSFRGLASQPGRTIARQIYPYSLIPGGVQDASDFAKHRVSDRVLMDHYRDVGAKLARVQLHRDQWMYASYRVADAVFWTKKRVLVHAGEDLLSDGKNLIRARCGNRLSEQSRTPVKQFEPPVITTDRFTTEIVTLPPPELVAHPGVPLVPPVPAEIPIVLPPPDQPLIPPESLVTPAPPLAPYVPVTPVVPVIPSAPVIYPSAPPVTVIPETSTWLLMLGGLIAVVIAGRRRIVCRDACRDAASDPDP